jgi:hypothetical protein
MTPSADGAQVRITTTANSLTTRVIADGVVSEARSWKTSPSQPVYLASLAAGRTVRVSLPNSGDVTFCVGG